MTSGMTDRVRPVRSVLRVAWVVLPALVERLEERSGVLLTPRIRGSALGARGPGRSWWGVVATARRRQLVRAGSAGGPEVRRSEWPRADRGGPATLNPV